MVTMSDGNGTQQSVIDNLVINAVAVPEPASAALMLAGLAMLGFAGRRSRRNK